MLEFETVYWTIQMVEHVLKEVKSNVENGFTFTRIDSEIVDMIYENPFQLALFGVTV